MFKIMQDAGSWLVLDNTGKVIFAKRKTEKAAKKESRRLRRVKGYYN